MAPFRDPALAHDVRVDEVRTAVAAARAELDALDVEARVIDARFEEAALAAGTPSFWSRFGLGFTGGLAAAFLLPFVVLALLAGAGVAPLMMFHLFR